MLHGYNPNQDLEDTITDLEFFQKKVRLLHKIELKEKEIEQADRETSISLTQEVYFLRNEIEKLEKERVDSLS